MSALSNPLGVVLLHVFFSRFILLLHLSGIGWVLGLACVEDHFSRVVRVGDRVSHVMPSDHSLAARRPGILARFVSLVTLSTDCDFIYRGIYFFLFSFYKEL